MARRFANCILLLLVCALGQAADFGRFGYRSTPNMPGWQITSEGLKPRFPRSDTLYFTTPVTKWLVATVRAHEASYTLVGGGTGPTRIRANLFAPGPEMLFERGFSLKVTSLQAPLLSWAEGSVGEGVETPRSRWLAMSYQDSQPPVLFCFLNEPVSLKVVGRPGDWVLEVVGDPYKKWVRFALPLGVRALTTTDASALGAMVQSIKSHESFWRGPSPVLKKLTATSETDAVTGTWQFSGPNAVVPIGAFLARKGGYNVQLTTEVREVSAPSDEGPVAYTPETTLSIRFPVLNLPRGRSITAGSRAWRAAVPITSKPFSIFNSALGGLLAPRAKSLPDLQRSAMDDYLERIVFTEEPNTGAQLPFSPDGAGAGEAAMFSLLQQTLSAGDGVNTRPNALFTSLLWARDSLSWDLPMIADPKIRRRAAAVAAIAGALSADPKMKLDGAMFQAGLAAERGLGLWQGRTPPELLLEPVESMRQRLFKAPELPKREPILPMLVNPVRVLIGPPLTANNTTTGYRLSWIADKPGIQKLVLTSPQGMSFTTRMNAKLDYIVMNDPERYELQLFVAKRGEVLLDISTEGTPIKLPPTADIIYTEAMH